MDVHHEKWTKSKKGRVERTFYIPANHFSRPNPNKSQAAHKAAK